MGGLGRLSVDRAEFNRDAIAPGDRWVIEGHADAVAFAEDEQAHGRQSKPPCVPRIQSAARSIRATVATLERQPQPAAEPPSKEQQ